MKPNFEEILTKLIKENRDKSTFTKLSDTEIALLAMGISWNKALEKAAKNATCIIPRDGQDPIINEDSILKLKV